MQIFAPPVALRPKRFNPANRARMKAGVLAGALAALALGGCANNSPGEAGGDNDALDRTRRGVADAAISPLRDIGLVRPDIPAPLVGLSYPYQATQLIAGCPQILYEIGQLDAVLGKENYQPGRKATMIDRGMDSASNAGVGVVQDAAEDLIPFRGWVRRASGADDAQRRYIRALELGHTRRSFLRGYGVALGCTGVLPEPPPAPAPTQAQPTSPVPPPQARDTRAPR
jgi:hypothetical protein